MLFAELNLVDIETVLNCLYVCSFSILCFLNQLGILPSFVQSIACSIKEFIELVWQLLRELWDVILGRRFDVCRKQIIKNVLFVLRALDAGILMLTV